MAKPSAILPTLFLGLGLLLFAAVSAAAAAGGGGGGSITDVLRAYGLPAGIFPKEVESFAHDPATGLLEVRLDKPCFAKYDGLAKFDQVVKGNLSHGELRGVEGLSQEELFIWLPVKGILVPDPSSGVILLDIGLAHKQLSLSLFENPPECRPDGRAIRQVAGQGIQGRKVGRAHEQR